MAYLRSLFVALTIAVQLVTLAYVLVIMGNSQAYDDDRSIVNATDARAVYYLAAVAALMTVGMAVLLWRERRGPSRRAGGVPPAQRSAPVRSSRRSQGDRDTATGTDSSDRGGSHRGGSHRDGKDTGGSEDGGESGSR